MKEPPLSNSQKINRFWDIPERWPAESRQEEVQKTGETSGDSTSSRRDNTRIRLEHLESLLRDGLVREEEYQQKRQEILRDL